MEVYLDGVIYVCGACDDKGQFFMYVKVFEVMMVQDVLFCNIKFMIEGEEEVGFVNFGIFCWENQEKFKCDIILIFDIFIIVNDVFFIIVGLCGLSYFEVEVVGFNCDLYFGVYGGGVVNLINVFCDMVSFLMDDCKYIIIFGFYDDVVELLEVECKKFNEVLFDLEKYKKDFVIGDVQGEVGYMLLECVFICLILDVNGIWGGYIGEGVKMVLFFKVNVKISMCLVLNQDLEKIMQLFKQYFECIVLVFVKVIVMFYYGGEFVVMLINMLEYKVVLMVMEMVFGKMFIFIWEGGSIFIVVLFEQVLNVKSVLMGFGFNSDVIYLFNEYYGLFNFYKGIEMIFYFFVYYVDVK